MSNIHLEFDEEEKCHWQDVLLAYREYSLWMTGEMHRRDTHATLLPEKYRAMLPSGSLDFKSAGMVRAVRSNQDFLNLIAADQEEGGFQGSSPDPSGEARTRPTTGTPRSPPGHFSKVKSTLHQIMRDWSEEGLQERQACYGPILQELQRALPVTPANRNRQRVLVPGCGLGRFPFDLACSGYAAQGNEFSYFMLFASNFIMNGGWEEPNCACVHPWIGDPSNHLRPQDMLRPIPFPDIPPSRLLDINPEADLSMVAGEFTEVYGAPDQAGAWDAVATCFFLDTAPVVFEYLETIWHALRPGGVWVNLGPLLYHWQSPEQGGSRKASESSRRSGVGAEAGHACAGEDAGTAHSHSHAQTGQSHSQDTSDSGFGAGPDGVDQRYGRSLELTYQEVRHAIQAFGFQLVHESRTPACGYAGNRLSLMKVVYQPLMFTAVKPLGSGQLQQPNDNRS